MNKRFYIKKSEFGTDAAAVLPSENKVLQIYIGNDGSRTIQVHQYYPNKALTDLGCSGYAPAEPDEVLHLFNSEYMELLLSFLQAAFGCRYPKDYAMQISSSLVAVLKTKLPNA